MTERLIPVDDVQEQRLLFGSMDRNLRAIRERWGVSVSARRGRLRVSGDDPGAVDEVARRIGDALSRARDPGGPPTDAEILSMLVEGRLGEVEPRSTDADEGRSSGSRRGRPSPPTRSGVEVRPLTAAQEDYVQAIRSNDVVFGIGPAGTGKTYLAVAEAVASLRARKHRKLVLTRPAVEAGERLGFLPGGFVEKINPYLRPLYDALGELLRFGEVQRSMDTDVIEIVPLAYMRGRTLKHAFIILDEAQNTTPMQMKMFLTRFGSESKVVVTGDVTQTDLPPGTPSGLVEAARILEGVPGAGIVRFQRKDVIRHPMVERIVEAYEREESRRAVPRREDEGQPRPA